MTPALVVMTAPQIPAWAMFALIVISVVGGLTALQSHGVIPEEGPARQRIVMGLVIAITLVTVGASLTHAVTTYDPRIYCEWNWWWDIVTCGWW